MSTTKANRSVLAAAAALVCLSGEMALAATVTWANVGTDFNTPANWNSGSGPVPGSSDVATFSAARISNPDLSSSLTVQGVSFSAGASGYTLSASSGQSLTLTAGTPITNSITSGTNTISASMLLSGGGTKTFSGAGGGTTVISGNITEGTTGTAIGLSGGSSIWTFSGDNRYSGNTTLNNSGVSLNIGSATALGTGTLVLAANTHTIKNASGGAITIANAVNLTSASGNSFYFAGPNDMTIDGTVTLSGGGSASLANTQKVTTTTANSLTFGGTVAGAGKGIVKDGIGTLVLAGTNTFTGPVNVTYSNTTGNVGSSVLQFVRRLSLYNGNTASWTASNILVSSSAASTSNSVLAFNVGGTGEFTSSDIDTIKGLYAASGGVGGGAGGFQANTFLGLDTTNAAGGNFVYNSSIANVNSGATAIGLMKLGANTLTLGGTNTYTGKTVVSGGNLLINGDASGATGTVSVGSGAAIGGSGTIGGATTLATGGRLGVADGVGHILTFASSSPTALDISAAVAGASQNTLLFELGAIGASDEVVLSGSGNLKIGNGTLDFADFAFTPLSGLQDGTYTLFHTNNLISGTLASSGLSGTIGTGTGTLSLSADGKDVVLTMVGVPEPTASAILLVSSGMLLASRRRRMS